MCNLQITCKTLDNISSNIIPKKYYFDKLFSVLPFFRFLNASNILLYNYNFVNSHNIFDSHYILKPK